MEMRENSEKEARRKEEEETRRKMEEKKCLERRRGRNGDWATCTQEERDEKFGKGWKWNTRNCDTLLKNEKKKCKREKRKRCVRNEKRKSPGMSHNDAKQECRERKKWERELKKCEKTLRAKGKNKIRAKKSCQKQLRKRKRKQNEMFTK